MRGPTALVYASMIVVPVWLAGPAGAGPLEDARACNQMSPAVEAARMIELCSSALSSALISEKVRTNAFKSRGDAYRTMGQNDLAIRDYDDALRADPNYYDAYYGRGLAHLAAEDHERSVRDFDQVIRINDKNPDAYVDRGQAYAGLGQHPRAIQDYDSAIRLDPNHANAFYHRAMARNRLGDQEAAIQDFEQAMERGGRPMVERVQTYLKDRGKYRLRVDGKVGPGTRKALRECVADPDC